jgi:hypothetical protein
VVAAAPSDAEWHDVSADDRAYWRLVCSLWERSLASGEDVMILEHDVVCRPDVVVSFESCPEPWCTFGYTPICHESCLEAWANMLGCTRFRAELIATCADALTSIPDEWFPMPNSPTPHDRRRWTNLCDEIAGNKIGGVDQPSLRPGSVRAGGYSHHWHRPPVRHRSWEGRGGISG